MTEGKVKDIYFILLYPRKQPENPDEFAFDENSINPQNIFQSCFQRRPSFVRAQDYLQG